MFLVELKHMFDLIRPKFIFYEDGTLNNIAEALSILGISARMILLNHEKVSSGRTRANASVGQNLALKYKYHTL